MDGENARQQITQIIDTVQVPDCPNVPVLENRIAEQWPVEVGIVHHIVRDAEHAVSAGMTGSPTLLIDGRDPFATAGSVPSPACQLYPARIRRTRTPTHGARTSRSSCRAR
ncbi:hypothetical protein ACWFRF_05060 [Nocardia sp. NPDC055165]